MFPISNNVEFLKLSHSSTCFRQLPISPSIRTRTFLICVTVKAWENKTVVNKFNIVHPEQTLSCYYWCITISKRGVCKKRYIAGFAKYFTSNASEFNFVKSFVTLPGNSSLLPTSSFFCKTECSQCTNDLHEMTSHEITWHLLLYERVSN